MKNRKIKISLIEVPFSNNYFKKLYRTHYPGSRGVVGRRLNFVILRNGIPVGIIGFSSPPIINFIYEFFGISHLSIPEKSVCILNNNVFRVEVRERNLGTMILRIARDKVKRLYEERYGDTLLGLVTFVEPPRTGSLYRADNWEFIGTTRGVKLRRVAGFGMGDKWERVTGSKKLVFAYKYCNTGITDPGYQLYRKDYPHFQNNNQIKLFD